MNISYDKNEELSYVSDLFPFSGVDNLTNLMYLQFLRSFAQTEIMLFQDIPGRKVL